LVWISADKACQFLDEIPNFGLNATANAAKTTWNSGILFKIQVADGSNSTPLEIFYSVIY
jgi:putative alpha-1,2-mannosidase